MANSNLLIRKNKQKYIYIYFLKVFNKGEICLIKKNNYFGMTTDRKRPYDVPAQQTKIHIKSNIKYLSAELFNPTA